MYLGSQLPQKALFFLQGLQAGLPDFACCNITKWENICIPNYNKICQMEVKYVHQMDFKIPKWPQNTYALILHSKAYKNKQKSGFLV
jgi:hypothetical protein